MEKMRRKRPSLIFYFWRSSPILVQALTGFGIFLCLLSLYSLGTWFGHALVNSSNQVVWDVKTTQEGFLEVSKFLGDPRTTTHPSSSYNQDINVVFQTKDLYVSQWTRNVSQICPNKPRTLLLITVISAPHHVKERDAIRKGWGATALAMPKVALVFLVGQNESLLTDLIDESDHNQDLVITNHVDSYQNLTLKTLAAFDWMRTFCPKAEYLLKTDDDMFIQVRRLIMMIRGLQTGGSGGSKGLIVGNIASGWTPVRNPQSKYFITEEQYSEASYPPFATGPSYLVNRLAVNQIFRTALEHPFVHLEDVFLTGIIAEKCDIPRRLAIEFRNNAVRIPAQFLGCTLLRTISIHKVLPSEQLEMSKMARNPKCGKNQIVENFRKISSSTKSKLPKQST